MNKKTIDTYEDLINFLRPLQEAQKYLIDVHETNGKFDVQWAEHKKYTAQDGVEYHDEVWLTKENELKFIQDLEPEHCKNILRMIIRNERKLQESIQELSSKMGPMLTSMLADDDDDEVLQHTGTPPTFH